MHCFLFVFVGALIVWIIGYHHQNQISFANVFCATFPKWIPPLECPLWFLLNVSMLVFMQSVHSRFCHGLFACDVVLAVPVSRGQWECGRSFLCFVVSLSMWSFGSFLQWSDDVILICAVSRCHADWVIIDFYSSLKHTHPFTFQSFISSVLCNNVCVCGLV